MKQTTLIRRQTFVSCGLSEKEALLYDLLLTHGEATAAELEKESGLKKNTYVLLRSLVAKNLAIPVRGSAKERYQAVPPQMLMQLASQQEESARQTTQAIEKLLPSLSSQYQLAVGKPTIRYFEGEDGLRAVFRDIYAPKSDVVYGCVDMETADRVFPHHILKDLIPLRIKNKLFAYSLVADSRQAQAIKLNDVQQLRQTILIDKEMYPVPAEIDVYEDKIAMLSFERGKFIGIIIQNAVFAQSLRSLFKRIFDRHGQSPVASVAAPPSSPK